MLKDSTSIFGIDIKDHNGYSSLHWACSSGSYQAIRYLLAFHALPNLVSETCGSTPLILAIKNMKDTCEPRIIHKLMIYGADPNIKDRNNKSCIEYIKEIDDGML